MRNNGRRVLPAIVFALLGLLAAGGSARAQAAATPEPPAASNGCQTPGLTLHGDVPLARVLEAFRDRKVIRILTIGASSRVGRNTNQGGYYAVIRAVLERTIPGVEVEIIDRGASGELAAQAGERIRVEVALTNPDLVLWQLGTSDALAQIHTQDFRQTTLETLTWLREHRVDVVLVGLHYIRSLRNDPGYQELRTTLKQLAEEQKVLHISRYDALQLIEQAGAGAGGQNEFEQTEEGYNCLAEYVTRALTAGIFSKRPVDGGRQRN